MSIDTSSSLEVGKAADSAVAGTWSRMFADYLQLTKPRILVMILLTVAVAIVAVPGSSVSIWVFIHAMIGTGLVAASASVLNQWYEQEQDALMPRTARRPLPDGRLTSMEAALLGWVLLILGTAYLAILTNYTAAFIGFATWALYVWVYTPMKRFSFWNTAIGTIPGAMPVLIGWTAADGSLQVWQGWLITLILVLWQFPHFMSIAWLYRDQYDQAGYQMLTNVDRSGRSAARHAIVPAIALIPLVVVVLQPTNILEWMLAILGVVVCMGQIAASWKFMKERSTTTARRLLHSSLVFLPSVLALIVVRSFL